MIAIMMNRRDVLAITPLLLLNAAASQAEAQAIQQPRWGPVFQHDLPNLTLDGWQVTVSEIDENPGNVERPHLLSFSAGPPRTTGTLDRVGN